MRIESYGDGKYFVICKGRERESYFSFFVDGHKSSWSRHAWEARRYSSIANAQDDLIELKRRGRKT